MATVVEKRKDGNSEQPPSSGPTESTEETRRTATFPLEEPIERDRTSSAGGAQAPKGERSKQQKQEEGQRRYGARKKEDVCKWRCPAGRKRRKRVALAPVPKGEYDDFGPELGGECDVRRRARGNRQLSAAPPVIQPKRRWTRGAGKRKKEGATKASG